MVFMVKCVSLMLSRGLQKFIDYVSKLLTCSYYTPHYSCSNKRAKMVSIKFKTKTKEVIYHLVTDSTGLKVYDES
ncbi:Mobile element protein [Candidatus Enterovibrio altilux]|uniref:Mobile element protein n=1 Tax=Candidatus Enterovibrio altilux TaxID=1927128 RepID=A0A291BA59_9GAMM|nr:Mobile element protein [Candidatus Enterovibrio luxaltus]